jgi:hypothetical protein
MMAFYLAFPICGALRHDLNWTHYRTLMRVSTETEERAGRGPKRKKSGLRDHHRSA